MRRAAWIVGIVIAWLHCRAPASPCVLAQAWHAPRPHYDYLQTVELRGDGTGELVMGEGQLVRSEVTVRYAVERGAIRFEYIGGSHARPREIAFAIARGDFTVVEGDYEGAREHHYRCRLELAADPFPPDVASDPHRTYYACER